MNNTWQPIMAALRYLAGLCDGAQSEDGQGFNKPDSLRCKRWAALESLNERQARDAYDRLRKYTAQLDAGGIDFTKLPVPPNERLQASDLIRPNAEQSKRRDTDARAIRAGKDAEGDHFQLSWPYSDVAALLEPMKDHFTARRYVQQPYKHWRVPADYRAARLMEFGVAYDFEISPEACALFDSITIPDALPEGEKPKHPDRIIKRDLFRPERKGKAPKEGIGIYFDYVPAIHAAVKEMVSPQYFGEGARHWVVSLDSAAAVAKLAAEFGFNVEPETRALLESEAAKADAAASLAAKRKAVLMKAAEDIPRGNFGGKTPRDYQAAGVSRMLEAGRSILADDMGLGKGQPASGKVATPNGWQMIGTLRPGDYVIGSDGKPVSVRAVYLRGVLPIFKVTFSDGSSLDVDADHIWTVKDHNTHHRGGDWYTMTTRELMLKGLKDGNGNRKYRIPMVKPVIFDHQDLPFDPYLMGVFLGDGSFSSGYNFNICTGDEAVPAECMRVMPRGASLERIEPKERAVYWKLRGFSRPLFESLGLLGSKAETKQIPWQYMHGSPDQRLALLQGLMDTDGTASLDGCVSFSSASSKLARGVIELVQSLGGTARLSLKRAPKFSYKGEQKTGQPSWIVTLAMPERMNPFRAFASRYKERTKYPPQRLIESIEAYGQDEVVCISVDAPDSLYVAESYIVTHNTFEGMLWARCYQRAFGAYVFIVCPVALMGGWIEEAAACHVRAEVYSWAKVPPPPSSPFVLICDEAHYAQSIKSQRTQAVLELSESEHCLGVVMATGTPMRGGRPVNIFPLLKAVKHPLARNKSKFEERYCAAHQRTVRTGGRTVNIWDTTGAAHLDELMREIAPQFLRRTKEQVLKDLPAKTILPKPVDVDAEGMAIYQEAFNKAQAQYNDRLAKGEIKEGAEALVLLTHLKRAAALAMVKPAIDLADEVIEQKRKVLMYSEYPEVCEKIAAHYRSQGVGAEVLTGQVKAEDRDTSVKRFQFGASRVFCLTKAGGVGLTLTAASDAFLVDQPWMWDDVAQIVDRLHRKDAVMAERIEAGQAMPVNAYLLSGFEVNQKIQARLFDQRRALGKVMAGDRRTMRGVQSVHDIAKEIAHELFGGQNK